MQKSNHLEFQVMWKKYSMIPAASILLPRLNDYNYFFINKLTKYLETE